MKHHTDISATHTSQVVRANVNIIRRPPWFRVNQTFYSVFKFNEIKYTYTLKKSTKNEFNAFQVLCLIFCFIKFLVNLSFECCCSAQDAKEEEDVEEIPMVGEI
jgi:hypothetical protein